MDPVSTDAMMNHRPSEYSEEDQMGCDSCRAGATLTEDVDMAEAREEPAATEVKKVDETAAAPTEEDENTVKPVLTTAAAAPLMPVSPPGCAAGHSRHGRSV